MNDKKLTLKELFKIAKGEGKDCCDKKPNKNNCCGPNESKDDCCDVTNEVNCCCE